MRVVTACTMDCPDACSLVATVADQRVIGLQGNPNHPITAGFTCKKIKKHPERLQSSERIVRPMLRRGDRWEPISWEAALALCARKIDALRHDPAAIAHVRASGAKGITKEAVALFFDLLGASRTRGSLCDAAGIMAYHYDFGSRENHHTDDLLNARRIINWGKDLSRSSIHTAAMVRKARKQGATVLMISPCPAGNETLRDDLILIRPGSDRFLAAAVLRRLIVAGCVDDRIISRVRHWQTFRELMHRQSEKELIRRCGVSSTAVDLLHEYYTAPGAAATLIAAGVQRYQRGGENVRYINALALLSGHIGRQGGGSYFHLHSTGLLNMQWAHASHRPNRRSLQIATIGRDLLTATAPEIQVLWINGVNLVNQAPHSRQIIKSFEKIPFVVVVDAFWNDTALRADLVLPCALMLEQEDVIGSYLHSHIQYAPQVVPPPGEARTDHWMIQALGRRLNPAVEIPSTRACMEAALDSPRTPISLKTLQEKSFFEVTIPKVAYGDLQFHHPDGRARLPLQLHGEAQAPRAYPLRLLSLVRRDVIHSQIPPQSQPEIPRVWIAPGNAAWRQLDMDQPVYLVSPLGRLQVQVHPIEELHGDAVVYRRGDWMALGGGINQIISDQPADIGGSPAYYQQYVRLENGS